MKTNKETGLKTNYSIPMVWSRDASSPVCRSVVERKMLGRIEGKTEGEGNQQGYQRVGENPRKRDAYEEQQQDSTDHFGDYRHESEQRGHGLYEDEQPCVVKDEQNLEKYAGPLAFFSLQSFHEERAD